MFLEQRIEIITEDETWRFSMRSRKQTTKFATETADMTTTQESSYVEIIN